MNKVQRKGVDVRYYADNGTLLADERIARLCASIKADGSLARGAREAHISYSKAWDLISSVERILGFPLTERKRGMGSTLTPEGEKYLSGYNKIVKSSEKKLVELLDNLH